MDIKKFAQQLTNKANQFAENVAQYVDDQRTMYRLTSELTSAKEYLEALFAELGRLVYHGNAALAGVRSKDEILADIHLITETVVTIEAEMEEFLTKNKAPEQPESNETPVTDAEDDGELYCHKCGKPQIAGSEFCNKCGTKLVK